VTDKEELNCTSEWTDKSRIRVSRKGSGASWGIDYRGGTGGGGPLDVATTQAASMVFRKKEEKWE